MARQTKQPAPPRQGAFRETFDSFYIRERESIVGLALVLSRSRTAAEDLAQEAFIQALIRWVHGRQRDGNPDYYEFERLLDDAWPLGPIVPDQRTEYIDPTPPVDLRCGCQGDHHPGMHPLGAHRLNLQPREPIHRRLQAGR